MSPARRPPRRIGRRDVLRLALLLGALPLVSNAQDTGKVWRLGFLSPYSTVIDKSRLVALEQGLRELGYVAGKNVVIEPRYADGHFDRLSALAAELVRLPLDVIVAHGDAGVHAKQATSSIPIVVVANPDPVGMGIAASLARPGGNLTGLSDQHSDLVTKRISVLKEAIPSALRIGVLFRANVPAHPSQVRDLQAAAPALRVAIVPLEIRGHQDFDRVFSTIRKERVDAVNILGGATGAHRRQFAELAIKHRVPTISTTRESAEDGLLLSYGASFPDLYRRAATYVDRILKGAKPADLPIEQPTKLEFVVNRRTAKALGLALQPSLALQADHIID